MPTFICPECGATAKRSAKYISEHRRVYCNRDCYTKAKTGVPLKDYVKTFWEKVEKTTSCWLWRGAVHSAGYGSVKKGKKTVLAHRLAWELVKGPIPEGMDVCHNCPTGDNRLCVNPHHLFLGNAKTNREDAAQKNRLHFTPIKLSREDAERIREDHASGNFSYAHLAFRFGVSKSHISNIVLGNCWKGNSHH